jgi:hypothetical protein
MTYRCRQYLEAFILDLVPLSPTGSKYLKAEWGLKMPNEQRKLEALFSRLVRARKHEFPHKRGRLEAPTDRGVYVIYDPNEKPAHVGSTPRAKHGIRQRLADHLAGKSSFTKKHLKKVPAKLRPSSRKRGYLFQCLVVEDDRLRALLEAYAIGHLCPAHMGHGLMATEHWL